MDEKNELTTRNTADNGRCPELMTEEELVIFLRIPEISGSQNYHNVIENLKNMRNLPRIHLCNKVLYPLAAIREWIEKEINNGE